MGKTIYSTLLWILALICQTTVSAGPVHYTLSNPEGLSNSSVTCVTQDSRGLLWVGTWDGLNIYDSRSFKILRNEPGNPNTISDNIIRDIEEQRDGIMWVSTDNGINRIDVNSDTIRRFYPGYEDKNPLAEQTFSITVTPDRNVFCSSFGWGMAFYDETSGQMIRFSIDGIDMTRISGIWSAGTGILIIRTNDGTVYSVNYSLTGTDLIEISGYAELVPGTRFSSVFESGSAIYLVSDSHSLYIYNPAEYGIRFSGRLPVKEDVKDIVETGSATLAVATDFSGIYEFNIDTGESMPIGDFSDVNIFSLYYGTQDILWVGTDGQGLRAIYDNSFCINKVTNSQLSDSRSCPVRTFFQDKYGNLFIGTKGNGVYVLKDGVVIRKYDTSNGLDDNAVYSLAGGMNDDVFVGHEGDGINVISLKTWEVSSIQPENEGRFGSVYSFLPDREHGCLWMGSSIYGLVRLGIEYRDGRYGITETKTYCNNPENPASLNDNIVFPIVQQNDSTLWVGTRKGGLNRFDINREEFSHYTVNTGSSPISSNEILSLLVSADSTLWIGTGYGLNRLTSYKDGECIFEPFTVEDGLRNNTINGIEEDSSGNLWLSTNKGLSVFNPRTHEVTNYWNNNALQDNEYAHGAYYKDRDGNLYFGGKNGFNWFDPAMIKPRTYQPEVIISEFYSVLSPDRPVNTNHPVTLDYKENSFTIKYSALEYIDNANCEYNYRLEGFDQDWIHAGTEHIASYTNVPPGNYTFLIHCTNGDKLWSDRITALEIRVCPPWWNTAWAFAAYFLLAVSAAYFTYRAINARSEQRHRLEVEEIKRKQLEETYEAKLRFFTNIAHEFSTPLTLICGPLEQIMNNYKFPPKVEKYQKIIHSNAERMMRLIQELIEFRRIDTANEQPIYSHVNISDTVHAIIDNFAEINEKNQISMETEISRQDIVTDQNAIEKILYNLISNAYKYTPAGGRIRIRVSDDGSKTKIDVWNTGKGIKPEDLSRIFDRFVILDNYEYQASKGKIMRNGIGMALTQSLVKMLSGEINVSSETGRYTEFSVSLPHAKVTADENRASEREPSMPEITDIYHEQSGPVNETDTGVKKKIMIVDDESHIRELVKDILESEYSIIQAEDGLDAINKLQSGIPDMIITDINMPRMNGVDLLRHLKDSDVTRFIPVIFLAFKTDLQEEIDTYEIGSELFIPKPFHPKHLAAIVHRILDNRTLLKTYYSSSISSTDLYEGDLVGTEDKEFLMQLTTLIEQNITDENLSPSWLCEKVLVSKMQLYRKLKELTQQTPSEFIRSVKINHAVHLLKTTTLTVQEIMYSSGFNNKSYFYREFSEKYHMSPAEFRKENR